MQTIPHKLIGTALAGLWLCFSALSATAQIIYQDTFSGTGTLNGSTPTTTSGLDGGTSGAAWTADSNWIVNGSGITSTTTTTESNAFLPFSPVSGQIYVLSANIWATNPSYDSWVALGFTL